jgi:RNA polymerase primary sigma factor
MVARSRRVKSDLEVYLKQIDELPLLSADEEKFFARKIINEDCMASRERMIRSNLRLVVAIAKRYMHRGLPLQDLIEEGNVGLVKAVEGFDPDMGARFSTYGCWWIKQAIKRALINAVQPIHIPAYMVELIARWKKASRVLEERLGRQPSIQELAEEMDLPTKKVRIIRKAVKASQRPVQPGSGGDGEAPTLSEMIQDDRTPSPDSQVLLEDDLQTIETLLDAIDEREATILRLRFGLDGNDPLTLKEIGTHVNLTRERVRQIEIEALRKLNTRLNSDRPLAMIRAREHAASVKESA